MRCIYCDSYIEQVSFKSIFLKEDLLCISCRKKLIPQRKLIKVKEIEVETFFPYEGMFKSLLIQYKECFDEALYPVFLYDLKEYIECRYHGYSLCLIPSSIHKLNERGFHHLELMCNDIRLKRIHLSMIHQQSQQGKDSIERTKMQKNFIYQGNKVNKVLVLDDVVTTGSSLLGAYNALKDSAKEIKFLALSHR